MQPSPILRLMVARMLLITVRVRKGLAVLPMDPGTSWKSWARFVFVKTTACLPIAMDTRKLQDHEQMIQRTPATRLKVLSMRRRSTARKRRHSWVSTASAEEIVLSMESLMDHSPKTEDGVASQSTAEKPVGAPQQVQEGKQRPLEHPWNTKRAGHTEQGR